MKMLLTVGILALATLGLNLAAQDWYHDRDTRFQGEGWRMHLFEHVRTDLEYVQHNAHWAADRERRRLERTKQELGDLQAKLEGHRYDEHELSDVIDSIRKSANDTRLTPQDHDVLTNDLTRLEDYRAHHEHWGEHM